MIYLPSLNLSRKNYAVLSVAKGELLFKMKLNLELEDRRFYYLMELVCDALQFQIVREMRFKVEQATGLTCSAGIYLL